MGGGLSILFGEGSNWRSEYWNALRRQAAWEAWMDREMLSLGTGKNHREMGETITVLGNWDRICGKIVNQNGIKKNGRQRWAAQKGKKSGWRLRRGIGIRIFERKRRLRIGQRVWDEVSRLGGKVPKSN
uniref:Uncharacterized protein n=1 Tax=Saimiri boliviensis boliviensis TaxID=39432 RepID=A0A2K6S4L1_SAIBB